MNRIKNIFFIWIIVFGFHSGLQAKENTPKNENGFTSKNTQQIFNQSRQNVYQIRVVSKKSGQKRSTGSGFRIAPTGYFITNYHVISQAVLHPDDYGLEYRTTDNLRGKLKLRNIDVVNDLALLELVDEGSLASDKYVNFSNQNLSNGATIFSIGNPHDIGMTIVDGIYNGLSEKTVYQTIIFSGALNSGMSGGPALDTNGDLVGVNVSTGGDDLAYLIPAKFVRDLLEKPLPKDEWEIVISKQLIENSERIIESILSSSWENKPFEEFKIPENLHSAFKCWGTGYSESEEKNRNFAGVFCDMEEYVYISSDLYTGNISYSVQRISSTKLNPVAFSEYYKLEYEDIPDDVADKEVEDVSEFTCDSSFVTIANNKWKSAICSRTYDKYKGIRDIYFKAALMGRKQEGYVIEVFLDGFSTTSSHSFLKTFLEAIE